LTVGTIEPRKAYAQVLDAFDALWRQGADTHLVIVGRAGWLVDEFVTRLRRHPEHGRRLFWFEDASDAVLRRLYRSSSLLLAASHGEGFGLPLSEAARHGLPLLLRDLPVFREAVGENAAYFRGEQPDDIARALERWFAADRAGEAPSSNRIACVDWAESARRLLATIENGDWHCVWEP
jgi:glycosyltransferase involved in cell wall biosynthesis